MATTAVAASNIVNNTEAEAKSYFGKVCDVLIDPPTNGSYICIDLSFLTKVEQISIIRTLNEICITTCKLILVMTGEDSLKNKAAILNSFILAISNPSITSISIQVRLGDLGYEEYLLFLKKILERPNFCLEAIDLSESALDKLTLEEQRKILFYVANQVAKLPTLKTMLLLDNNLWTEDSESNQKLILEAVKIGSNKINLWPSDHNKILNHKDAKTWDEQRKINFLKLFMSVQSFNESYAPYMDSTALPAPPISYDAWYKLLSEFLESEKPDKLPAFFGVGKLSEEHTFDLVKKYTQLWLTGTRMTFYPLLKPLLFLPKEKWMTLTLGNIEILDECSIYNIGSTIVYFSRSIEDNLTLLKKAFEVMGLGLIPNKLLDALNLDANSKTKLTKEISQLKISMEGLITKIKNKRSLCFRLNNAKWNEHSVTKALTFFKEYGLNYLTEISIDLSSIDLIELPFVIEFLNKTSSCLSEKNINLVVEQSDFSSNTEIEKEKLIAFLKKVVLKRYVLTLEIPLSQLGHQNYSHFLNEVFGKSVTNMVRVLVLSCTNLNNLSINDAEQLLLNTLYLPNIHSLEFTGNTLWTKNFRELKLLLDKIAQSPIEIMLWNSFETICQEALANTWSTQKRKEFLRLYLYSKSFYDFKESLNIILVEKSWSISLSQEEWFELFLEYIHYGKRCHKVFEWLKNISLNDELKLRLAKKYMEMERSISEDRITQLNLNEDMRAELYLYCLSLNIACIDYEDFKLVGSKLPIGVIISAVDMPELTESAVDIEAYYKLFQVHYMPKFIKACQEQWPDVSTEFYLPLTEKLKQFQPNFHNMQKIGELIDWMIASIAILSVKPKDSVYQNAKLIEILLKNIIDFSDISICYTLMYSFLNFIWEHSRGISTLKDILEHQLTKEKAVDNQTKSTAVTQPKEIADNQAGKKTWTILLGIPLCKMVLSAYNASFDASLKKTVLAFDFNPLDTEAKKFKEKTTQTILSYLNIDLNPREIDEDNSKNNTTQFLLRAKHLLNNIPKAYKKGHFLRSLIATVSNLSEINELKPIQKIALVENILDIKHIDSKVNTETLAQMRASKTLKREKQNAVSKAEKLKKQLSSWILLQGLAGLNEIGGLNEVATGTNLSAQLAKIITTVFKLEKEKTDHYQNIFSGLRNEGALLTYFGKIRQLPPGQKIRLENTFQTFIATVLSPKSLSFYDKRYALENSPHLKQVFEHRKNLLNLWKLGEEKILDIFIKEKNIVAKPLNINFKKYIENRIVVHNHMEPLDCIWLKRYLIASSSTEAMKIIKDLDEQIALALKSSTSNEKINEPRLLKLTESASTDPNIKEAADIKTQKETQVKIDPRMILLTLERELITLIEYNSNDKTSQLKTILKIEKSLQALTKDHNKSFEFTQDILTAQKKLLVNESALKGSLKGWKIIDTDHFWHLFMSGTDVPGSCQRVDGDPKLNKCLMSYVMDGKNRMLAIIDSENTIQARAIIRILFDPIDNIPVLFLEEIYPYSAHSILSQALREFALDRAKMLNLSLALSEQFEETFIQYPNAIQSLKGEIPFEYVDAIGMQVEEGEFTIPKAMRLFSQAEPLLERLNQLMNNWIPSHQNSTMISTIVDYCQPTAEEHDKALLTIWKNTHAPKECHFVTTAVMPSTAAAAGPLI